MVDVGKLSNDIQTNGYKPHLWSQISSAELPYKHLNSQVQGINIHSFTLHLVKMNVHFS
jgi:hypothetical protein